MRTLGYACFVCWLMVSSATAIIVDDYDIAEAPPQDLGDSEWDLDWRFVYKYKNSSAVAVAPYWLLTAAHVADDAGTGTVIIDGTNYIQQEIIAHAGAFDPDRTDTSDLALVRFDKAFPGFYPLYDGGFPSAPPTSRLSAILVGYGVTGQVSATSYTMSSTGSGIRRWGTQRIEGETFQTYTGPSPLGETDNDGIEMEFTLIDSPYEAGLGTHDSGGGTFVKDGGTWKLVGINTYVDGGIAGVSEMFAVSMPAYQGWITNVITPTADYDGDGIPNSWEGIHSSSITGLVASADDDGDGMSSFEEYVADTVPTDSNAVFRIIAAEFSPNHVITFDGSTNRLYRLQLTTNSLTTAPQTWMNAHTNAVYGSGTNTILTYSNSVARSFYRLRVSVPE